MREIKFRGKRVDNGEWVYGYYVQTPIFESRIYWKPFIESTSNTYHQVISESVGQFTGFKLKNDVEIYDGYILGDWTDVDGKMVQSRVPVFFDELTGQWMLDMSSMKDRSYSVSLFSDLQEYDYELLGNIYENPDLLSSLPL